MKILKKRPIKKAPDARSQFVTMTIEEKAQMIHDREMARKERSSALESVEILGKDLEISKRATESEKSWKESYQEENGKLHNELFRKRTGSFLYGTAFGCILSAIILYLC